MDAENAVRVIGSDFEHSNLFLEITLTIFQVEMLAIDTCIEEYIERGTRGARI